MELCTADHVVSGTAYGTFAVSTDGVGPTDGKGFIGWQIPKHGPALSAQSQSHETQRDGAFCARPQPIEIDPLRPQRNCLLHGQYQLRVPGG
eukprot:scaffold718_cov342-Pavlova_lutheri.AAC.17